MPLVNVTFRVEPGMYLILLLIGAPVIPQRIADGMYLCGHWSVDQLNVPIYEWWRERGQPPDYDEYGVCDTPEQPVERFKLRERPEQLFVSYVQIRRADQPRDGGWRWHKWGPYIGDQQPTCEYLHDEPVIEQVYTYHIYRIRE